MTELKCVAVRSLAQISEFLSPALMLVFSSPEHVLRQKTANACGISVGVFAQKFREAMDSTFGQFALPRRLSCAAQQLIATDGKVKRIAMEWALPTKVTSADRSNRPIDARPPTIASPIAKRREIGSM